MGVGAVGVVATSWSGVGGLLGVAAVVHGADGASHGYSQMITGEETKSYTETVVSNALQAGGVSPGAADRSAGLIDFTLSVAFSAGAGGKAPGSFSMLLKGGTVSKEAGTGGQGCLK